MYWTANAWQDITEATITKTFQSAGFVLSDIQSGANRITDPNENAKGIAVDDVSTALKDLDTLSNHITIGDRCLPADEFIGIDADIPTFDESNNVAENLIIIKGFDDTSDHHLGDEDDEIPTEAPPKLVEAMDMARRLHILATTEQPQLHHLIARLDSQLTELFLESKRAKQPKIEDYFSKTE